MSFNVLDINQSADISSAFLGSAIDGALEKVKEMGGFREEETTGFVALPPKPVESVFIPLPPNPKSHFSCETSKNSDMDQMNRDLKRAEQLEYSRHLLSLAEGSKATKDTRLVKKCKSPTRLSSACETYLESKRMQSKSEFFARAAALDTNHAKWLTKPLKDQTYTIKNEVQSIDFLKGFSRSPISTRFNQETGEIKPRLGMGNAIARVYENWAGNYRLRVMAQASASEPPPQQSGDRETSELSQKGASKVLTSGAYVSAVRGGFTTFLTLTFDSEARERIINQEVTIGKEVSRFFDASSKMYQRGWQCDNEILGHKNGFDCVGASEISPPKNDALDYLWVAEMPENKKTGKPNPHCHVLLRWNVEPHLFHDWAARIESLWGLGFAKLERIRNADAASGYLLKALGYMVKGESQEQGQFKGNRYNISKAARAPADECIAEFDAQNMCAIMNEIREKLERRNKPVKSIINFTRSKLAKYKKAYNIQKAKKGRTQAQRNYVLGKMQKQIAGFEQTIKDNYKKLTECGVRAQEYQMTFNSPELLAKFIGWATQRRYWGAEYMAGASQYRDYEKERQAQGRLVKAARDYWKSFGDNQEYSEQLWEQRIHAANNYQFNEPQSCDSYNEYLTLLTQ